MARLYIQTLGGFKLWRDDELISPHDWKTQKIRILFAILLTWRNRMLTQDQLIEWLWPDLTLDSARNSLRVAISHLRRLLEPTLERPSDSSFVHTEPQGYRLDTSRNCRVDADEFEAHYRQGVAADRCGDRTAALAHYDAALARYRGDYLPDDPYADWAMVERERLANLCLELLERQSQLLADGGDLRGAIQACQRILERDPCRERIYRRLMRFHYLNGDRGAALAVYDRCRTVLANELGVEPLAQTQALQKAICKGTLEMRGSHPNVSSIPLLSGLRPPFVGRHQELALLRAVWEGTLSGQPRFVLIRGEMGTGKSRLLAEFKAYLASERIHVLEGRSFEMERAFAYRFVLELVRAYLKQRYESVPTAVQSFLAEWVPQLRETPSVRPPMPVVRSLLPEQERQRLREGLTQCLLLAAGSRSSVFLLDDLHWADAATLDVVQYAVRRGETEVPHLYVATFRPEEVERTHPIHTLRRDLERAGLLTEIELSPLSQGEVVALLSQMLGSPENGLRLSQVLFTETLGNPFYLVEILRALLEVGVMWVDGAGQWHADYHQIAEKHHRLMLPATVREVILDRVARLDRQQQEWLGVAAVIGSLFDFEVLQAVTEADEDALLSALDAYKHRALLRERPNGQYEFSHDKIRSVLYEESSAVRRKRLHARIATALEALGNGTAADLGRHFLHAELWERALEYHLRAGQQATEVYAYDQALAFYEMAQQLAERLGDAVAAAEVSIELGSIYFVTGPNAKAIRYLRAGLDSNRGLLRRAQCARAVHYLAKLFELLGDYDTALEYLKSCEDFIETTPDAELSEDLIRVYDMLAWMHRRRGDYALALDLAQHGLEIVQRRKLSPPLRQFAVGLFEKTLGMTAWSMGKPQRALGHLEHSFAIWHRSEPTHYMGDLALDIGTIQYHVGAFDAALRYLEEAQRCYQRVGDVNGMALFHNNIGLVHHARGDYEAARSSFREALRLCEITGTTWYRPETLGMLALSHLALGHVEAALTRAEETLESARHLANRAYRGFAHRVLGEVYAVRAETRPQAMEHFERSLTLLQDADAAFDLALAHRAYGRALQQWGHPVEGAEHLHRARRIFEDLECNQTWLDMISEPSATPS